MGRQPYITRLALGRSPYEPPRNASAQYQAYRSRNHNADGYVQQYDERGHPIFPESKALARELRRAKNDVLSTMGVVVSGEAGRSSILKDKKAVNAITAENDYGLVIVAFDHAMHFFGSWWVSSLSRRVQTFRSYTNIPLIRLFKSERQRFGWAAECFAGIPLWAARIILPLCRTQLFEPLLSYVQNKLTPYLNQSCTRLVDGCFSMIRSSARLASFVFFEQVHMFCILQTLHLIPHNVFPRPAFLIPFTKFSLVQSPSLPSDFSLVSLGCFASKLAMSPFAFAFVYVLIRPIVEDKIYRLIRRHLPKQDRPDEISIQVAMENDLLEWTLPTAGRRTEEETRRSNMSLLEDMREELRRLQKWLFSRFGYNHDDFSDEKISICLSHNDIDTVRENIQAEPSNQNSSHQIPNQLGEAAFATRPVSLDRDQRLTEGQLTHSPGEITPNAIEVRPAERGEIVQDQSPESSWVPFQNYDQDSRSDTLFSRPQTPESPLTSPRIRASLTHQNSFTTTMELSLQSSRITNRQDELEPVVEIERGDTALGNWPVTLDQPPLEATELVLDQMNPNANDAVLEQLNTAADAGPASIMSNPTENDGLLELLNRELATMDIPPVLPHMIEEPMHSPTHQPDMDALSDPGTEASASRVPSYLPPWRSLSQDRSDLNKQRVTVLSSYPADALAHHLASFISGFIFIPFESFFYRSLARSYLSSRLPSVYGSNSLIPVSDIRPLNALAGGGSRRDMIAYICKLTLIQGIQAGVSGAILGVCSATAVGIGKRVFDWGNL
ncbi:conserved hypothetical protein [Talaromyces stipitatus ATCC 10500]|uniref:Uncharacterized protein n=1 Tax=Talaromyces stipitatus (strain ATCC 10500 / CBS 375.48 / QM 6759 / NRRL 1006) TaxID=441959 RepID=B8MKB2_TALSN|nr:uncharacterized protein TSTA_047180 [Talaromyces stipitatus ATCC 10500]EED15267.1 conserved hypothetical protein [Talaromyces stipitatus ATCC 10500]